MIEYKRPDPLAIAGRIRQVYATVFAESPYQEGPAEVKAFAKIYQKQAAWPGFDLVTAWDSDEMVGFAYGATRPPGWWWANCDTEPPSEVRAAEKFVVYEWAVLGPYRGRGVGRELLSRLLTGRTEPWATLNVDIRADAYQIYQAAGWARLGVCSHRGMPPMAAMARANVARGRAG